MLQFAKFHMNQHSSMSHSCHSSLNHPHFLPRFLACLYSHFTFLNLWPFIYRIIFIKCKLCHYLSLDFHSSQNEVENPSWDSEIPNCLATACFSTHPLEFFSSFVTGHFILNVSSFSQQIPSTYCISCIYLVG